MNRLRAAIFGGFYFLVLVLPVAVYAQNTALPKQVVPCNGAVAGNGLPACTCGHLVALAQNIINTAVFIFVFFSALMFAYAGFLYLTNEAMDKQKDARNIFGHVAMGLIVLLSAWLIVDTLMKSVLGGSFGPWNAVGSLDTACRLLGIK